MFFILLSTCVLAVAGFKATHSPTPAPDSVPGLVPHGREPITCDNVASVTAGKLVAVGARKQIAEAFSDLVGPVLVAMPVNGTWYAAHKKDKQRDAAYLAYFVGERDELRAAASHAAFPRLYGGCWSDLWAARTVTEYVEGWLSLADDAALDFNQRLVVAAKSLDLVALFDHFPIAGPNGARRVLLHEYHPQMFAVNATYDIKFVSHNQQRLVYLSAKAAPFGSESSCDSDHDCRVHLVDAKQIGAGLLLPEPPLEFACEKKRRRCRGIDTRLNLYAVAHVLWKPLFGLGGHPLVGGIVSDFFRPKVQQIVDAAAALDPADRPPVDDLRRALLALIRGQVPPYFLPSNADVRDFVAMRDKADKMLHGAPSKDAAPYSQIGSDEWDLPKPAKGAKPIALSNWFFKFQPTPQMPMTVRLMGVFQNQPWGSSPIYIRENATLLRTRSGKEYALVGAVNCEGLKTEGFSDEFCHKFHYGFPSRWKENLADAWDTQQDEMRRLFFAKNAPKHPLEFDVDDWLDLSELSSTLHSSAASGRGDARSSTGDDDSSSSTVTFSQPSRAKSGGVAHGAWFSGGSDSKSDSDSGDDSGGGGGGGGDRSKAAHRDKNVIVFLDRQPKPADDDDDTEAGSSEDDAPKAKNPAEAAAAAELLAQERAERDRLQKLAAASPCGAEGLEAEGVCCLTSCGACGGARCESHIGGRAGCCPDQIHRSALSCNDNLPPCVLHAIEAPHEGPPRVAPPADACNWMPTAQSEKPYDIDEHQVQITATPISASRCIAVQPGAGIQRGLIPTIKATAMRPIPRPGFKTIDLAVTVTETPLELFIGISNGTTVSFQAVAVALRFNGDTNSIDVSKNPSTTPVDRNLFHAVERGRTYNIRAVLDAATHTYEVSMRDFVGGAPALHVYAEHVPFVNSTAAQPFAPSFAVGGVADKAACARRFGFLVLLRTGGANICFAPITE